MLSECRNLLTPTRVRRTLDLAACRFSSFLVLMFRNFCPQRGACISWSTWGLAVLSTPNCWLHSGSTRDGCLGAWAVLRQHAESHQGNDRSSGTLPSRLEILTRHAQASQRDFGKLPIRAKRIGKVGSRKALHLTGVRKKERKKMKCIKFSLYGFRES